MSDSAVIGLALLGAAAYAYANRAQGQTVTAPQPQVINASYTPGPDWAGISQGLAQVFAGANPQPAQAQPVQPQGATMGQGLFGMLSNLFGGSGGQGAAAPTPAAQPAASGTNLAPLLNVIAQGEANAGYDTVYAGSPIQPAQPITTMTIAQVEDFQARMVEAGAASDPVGRYQFIGSTVNYLLSNGTWTKGMIFDKATQDAGAVALLKRRGLDQYQAGTISRTQFANNLAMEWASLPVVSGQKAGQSYYSGVAGNKARIGVSTVLGAIQGVA